MGPRFLSMRESLVKTSRGIILAKPTSKPVNIFRSKAVPKKGRNKNSSLGSITNGVETIISKVQGEKKSIYFLPPKLSLL